MNKKIIGISVLFFSFFFGCGKEKKEEVIRPVKVEMVGVDSSKKNILEYPTSLLSEKEAKLSFSIPGKIGKILVDKGAFVTKGQLLATLEKEDYILNAEANEQKYLASQATAENAVLQFERIKILYENKAIAKKDFDTALAQYKAAIAAAKGNHAGLSHAKKQLEDTTLKAPYDGYISNKFMDTASVVSAGTPILAISSNQVSELTIQVSNKDLDKIEKGEDFKFFPDDEEGKSYVVTLTNIGNAPDVTNMTYPVIFHLAKKEEANSLRSGVTGIIRFPYAGDETSEISVPLTALFEENGNYVFLYGKDGLVAKRKVEMGELRGNGRVTIRTGLQHGDKVIVAGISSIYEGEKVRLLPEESVTNVGKVL